MLAFKRAYTSLLTTTKPNPQSVLLRKQLKLLKKPSVVRPSRVPNSFALFIKDKTDKGDLSQLAKVWNEMDDSAKTVYSEKVGVLKEVYKKDFTNYLTTRTPEDFVLEKERYEMKKKIGVKSSNPKPMPDPQMPKMASAISLFMKDWFANEELRNELLGAEKEEYYALDKHTERFKVACELWNSLTSQVKAKYTTDAENSIKKRKNYLEKKNLKEITKTVRSAIKIPKKPKKKASMFAKKTVKPLKRKPVIKKKATTSTKKVAAKKSNMAPKKKASVTAKKSPAPKRSSPAPKRSSPAPKRSSPAPKSSPAKRK